MHDFLVALPENLRPRMRTVASPTDSLRLLLRGEATATAGNVLHLRHARADLAAADLVEIPITASPYYLATKKGHGGEFAWIPVALAKLKERGEFAGLVERYLAVLDPPTWRDYAWPVGGLLALLGSLATGIVVWNRSLRRQVAVRTAELTLLAQEKDRLARVLGESEARHRQLIQSVHAIVWRADAGSFRFSFVSKEAEAILGYPVERWTSEPAFWASQVHPQDRDRVLSSWAKAAADRATHEIDYRMIAADQRMVWFRDVVRIAAEEERPCELVGVMVDVTEQKQLEEQLRQSQKMEAIGIPVIGR